MNKIIALTALALVTAGAQAAPVTVNVTSGNWDDLTTWSSQTGGAPSPNTAVYDNGDSVPLISGVLPYSADSCGGGCPGTPTPAPTTASGTYSGSFTYDDVTGEVTAGSFDVTGNISQVVQGTWWNFDYVGTSWDFATSTTSHSSTSCHEGIGNPAGCYFAPFAPSGGIGAAILDMGAGNEGVAGTARYAGTFDGVDQLLIFNEGYDGAGSDYMMTFTIATSVVPVPAAVWLFGSALGLLGWGRRKA